MAATHTLCAPPPLISRRCKSITERLPLTRRQRWQSEPLSKSPKVVRVPAFHGLLPFRGILSREDLASSLSCSYIGNAPALLALVFGGEAKRSRASNEEPLKEYNEHLDERTDRWVLLCPPLPFGRLLCDIGRVGTLGKRERKVVSEAAQPVTKFMAELSREANLKTH